MLNRILFFCLFVCLCNACNKKNEREDDKLAPVITISTPTAGQVFTGGQSINITGSISDDNYIAEVHIHVTNSTTGALLMDVHLYPAAVSTSFSQPITAVPGTNYKITITAKDRAVNEGRRSVDVTAN